MDFYAGDIVRSLITDGAGLEKGEFGTVISVNGVGDPYVHWDKYNKYRHNGYGDIPVGHGWFVGKSVSKKLARWILVNCRRITISNFYLEMTFTIRICNSFYGKKFGVLVTKCYRW